MSGMHNETLQCCITSFRSMTTVIHKQIKLNESFWPEAVFIIITNKNNLLYSEKCQNTKRNL